jgi:tagaturonate reductase
MTEEIAPALAPVGISRDEACRFASKVLDRFRNPSLEHHWLSITMQYSSKMKMRNLPLLERHYKENSELPKRMALGFAAYILFMKNHDQNGHPTGESNGVAYSVRDDQAPWFSAAWEAAGEKDIASVVLGHSDYWETNLLHYPGFLEAVRLNLHTLQHEGARAVLNGLQQKAFSKQA